MNDKTKCRRHQNQPGSLKRLCDVHFRGHHSVGKSTWVKSGSLLSSQYVLLLTQVSSFDFLWRQKKSRTVMNAVIEFSCDTGCCYSDKLQIMLLRKKPCSLYTTAWQTNKSECWGYLKNLGWCVMLLSSITLRLSLCSCSILCFCSSAPSSLPSSSSLPAGHTPIHYANMAKHSSPRSKPNLHSWFLLALHHFSTKI